MTWRDVVSEEYKFVIEPHLLMHLEAWVASAGGREVSGVGTLNQYPEEKKFGLDRVWLMASGSSSYTEIPGAKMAQLIQEGVRPDQIKVWWHRHPVGNGITGPHNWSGTDNNTIREEPFGIDPSMVKWLVSVVRTPYGWVARYDNHEKKLTIHMKVDCGIEREEYISVKEMADAYREPPPMTSQPSFAPSRPTKFGPWKKHAEKKAQERLNLKQPQPIPHRRYDEREPRRYSGKGLEEGVYERARDALMYDAPEFVAYEFGITIFDMKRAGLLSQDELVEVERRIQENVSDGTPSYMMMIRAWETFDGQDATA